MYTIDLNKGTYNIKLIMNAFGKKTGRTIRKTIKKTDLIRTGKALAKIFSSRKNRQMVMPWSA